MAIDAEIVNFNDLDLVDNPSDTSELLIKTSDGIVKRVTKAELFEDEAAARTARDAELQNQIYTLAGAGSTEGSFRVVEKLDASLKGAANGVAELDSDGKIPSSQLPSFVDDVIEGYYNEADGDFYLHYTPSTVTHDIWSDGTDFINSDLTVGTEPSGTAGTSVALGNIRFNNDTPYMKDSDNWFEVTGLTSSAITVSDTAESDADVIAALEEAEDVAISYIPYEETVGGYSDKVTPETGKVYVDIRTNITYRWSGSQYTKIGSDLSLGETSSTAYRGDRGKIAYDHSQVVGTGTVTNVNPHGLSKADIGLGNVPNVTTDNQTPTFSAASTNQELESGETLSTLFGKLKKVVKSFIDHINTTISTNPHSTTKADVGLGDVINTGDSAVPVSGGTTKFTTGGAYTELEKKQDKNLTTPITIDGTQSNTVESALSNLNSAKANLSGSSFTGDVDISGDISADNATFDKDLSVTGDTTLGGTLTFGNKTYSQLRVQPDWNQTDNTADDYIKNKPQINSDCPYPVDSTYIQFPQCKAPATLWPGTVWTEMNFGGAFFRSSGGNADSFIDESGVLSAQADQVKSHSHSGTTGGNSRGHTHGMNHHHRFSLTVTGGNHRHGVTYSNNATETGTLARRAQSNSNTTGYTDYSGNLSLNGEGWTGDSYTTSNNWTTRNDTDGESQNHTHDFTTNSNDSSATENRPTNYTIKIWLRQS